MWFPWLYKSFPGGSDDKASVCLQCGRPRFNPWVGRSPREGNGNPLQYSCLENPTDRGAQQATVQWVTKNWTQLSSKERQCQRMLKLLHNCTHHGEGNGTPLQHSCLENPMDRGAWWAAVHGVAKSRTRLSNFTFTFHFHALEKEMATHSSVLAWRIPGMVEPGGLPSMGSHRVGHD